MEQAEIGETGQPSGVVRQDDRIWRGPATPGAQAKRTSRQMSRWIWARSWEFWLAVLLAGVLRLWRPDLSQFLDDQAGMMQLARQGILEGVLPVTSIPSSIGTLNPPLSVYLLAPMAFFTRDPLPNVVIIGLCNVLAVALCYIFALRYFGRPAAAVAALLLATCGNAVNYSRFLWPPNYLPLLTLLWAMTLYAGCVQGKRYWVIPNVFLLVLAILLHPVALLLIPALLVGVILAPHRPRGWEYAVGVLMLLALLFPSALWEIASHGSDIGAYLHYGGARSRTDIEIFAAVFLSFGAPSAAGFDPHALYYLFRYAFLPINLGVGLCFISGYTLLTVRVFRPAWAAWHGLADMRAETPSSWRRTLRRIRAWLRALYHGLRADASWRTYTLLWLWISAPIVGLIHHSSPVFVHYLIFLFPTEFIVAALTIRDLPVAIARWLAFERQRSHPTLERAADVAQRSLARTQHVSGVLVTSCILVLILAQTVQTGLYSFTLAQHVFDTSTPTSYGYPLGEMLAADTAISAIEREQGAHQAIVIMPSVPRYRAPAEYLLVDEHSDRVGVTPNCLLLPAPSDGPALVVSTLPQSNATTLLSALPNAQQVSNIPMPGGPSFAVYRVQGATPLLAGETAIRPITFSDASGARLTLVGAALDAQRHLRLRWVIDATTPNGQYSQGAPWYRLSVGSLPNATSPSPYTDCQPSHWIAGETLFTWVTLPTGQGGFALLSAHMGRLGLSQPTIGPLRLLGDAPAEKQPDVMLAPAAGDSSLTLGSSPLACVVNDNGAVLPLLAVQIQ